MTDDLSLVLEQRAFARVADIVRYLLRRAGDQFSSITRQDVEDKPGRIPCIDRVPCKQRSFLRLLAATPQAYRARFNP